MKTISLVILFQSVSVGIVVFYQFTKNKTKLGRFFNTFKKKKYIRILTCKPTQCSTLDGKLGAACCNLGYRCPCLAKNDSCKLYNLRPKNCRAFPNGPEDLKLVKNCSYKFIKR